MDMSGTATNDTSYTGAVCMSLAVVGNTTSLPLSDLFCNTDACLAFEDAHTVSQNAVSYAHQYDYGHYTTWYYLAILGVGMVTRAFYLYRNRRPPESPTAGRAGSASLVHRATAIARWINYRSFGGTRAANWGMCSLGMHAFILITLLFFLLMTFAAHPYYRERRGYGSPPLGVRAGLMSVALTPLIVALSGKVNVVTFLTGISHEKLNIFHRWTSYLCLFLAIVHTIPFIIAPLQACGPEGLRAQFYKPGGYEFSGTPPLGMLVGLVALSVPFLRHQFYIFFYRMHIPMYIVYLGLMFWHADDEGDSWAYLWATLAIWLFQVAGRFFYKWQTFHVHRNWFSGFSATVQELPGDMARITVLTPTGLTWKPGQHFWIRMPHLSILHNHPFTVANLYKETADPDLHEMLFYIRAHRGLTRDLLASIADRKDGSLNVHLDGPYGGLIEDIPALYQSLVFIAGGSGISACMPHMLNAAQRITAGCSMASHIRLVWTVKDPRHMQWVMEGLKQGLSSLDSRSFAFDVYVTGTNTPQQPDLDYGKTNAENSAEDKEVGIDTCAKRADAVLSEVWTVHNGSPFLPRLLPSLLTGRRAFVFACGPKSLRLDVGNAVAVSQQKVLCGEADVISLHTEAFGW